MDDNFVKNFKSNFRVLLSKCAKCTNSDETYEVEQNVPVLDDSGWLETSVVQRFDYSMFFDSYRHEIRQMRCYNSLLNLFSKNPFIQRFYDEFGGMVTRRQIMTPPQISRNPLRGILFLNS